MPALARLLGFSLCLSLVLGACGDEEDTSSGDDHDGGHQHDAEVEYPEAPCTVDYPQFRDGLSIQAGELTVRLLSVAPAPPRQKTPNDWTLELVTAAGAPAAGATVSDVEAFMKAHGHPGRNPQVVALAEPGRVLLDNIGFSMRGPWEVNFTVTPAGGAPTPATLQICVQ